MAPARLRAVSGGRQTAADGLAAPALPVPPDAGAPADADTLPGEDVLVLAVTLPPMTAAQRRAAIAFAVEERIAQPLDEVHVVPGPQLAGGAWLVAVAARDRVAAAPGTRRLIPDTLALPPPAAGWAVRLDRARARVRAADGSAFACPREALGAFWAAGGRPAVTLLGEAEGPLPVPVADRAPWPAPPDPALARFDLRPRGEGSAPLALPRGLRRLAAVAVLALAGHSALMAADLALLSREAAAAEAAIRARLALPVTMTGPALEAAAARALRPGGRAAPPFLPLMAAVFAAMAAEEGRIAVLGLRFDAATGRAVLRLEAPDIPALQAVETRLRAAGLTVSVGAATSADGAAQAEVTVAGGAP